MSFQFLGASERKINMRVELLAVLYLLRIFLQNVQLKRTVFLALLSDVVVNAS